MAVWEIWLFLSLQPGPRDLPALAKKQRNPAYERAADNASQHAVLEKQFQDRRLEEKYATASGRRIIYQMKESCFYLLQGALYGSTLLLDLARRGGGEGRFLRRDPAIEPGNWIIEPANNVKNACPNRRPSAPATLFL
jgi:hypothetical protein